MKLRKTITGILAMILLVSLASAWTGIPPNPLIFYGAAIINNSNVAINDIITVHEIDDSNQLVGTINITIVEGYYDDLEINWDNPDTPGDEGLNNTYPTRIAFKINGNWVTEITETSNSITPGINGAIAYATITDGIEGDAQKVDLTSFPNSPPVILVNNQIATQDSILNFNVNATDDTTYRTDTLTISQSGTPTVSLTNNIGNSTLVADASWTPDWNDACNSPFTTKEFTVTDDGNPIMSNSTTITITVINKNDTPTLNNKYHTLLINEAVSSNLLSVWDDLDKCFSWETATFGYTGVIAAPGNYTFNFTNTTTGTYDFVSDTIGIYRFGVNVTDSTNLSATAEIRITVTTTEILVLKTIEALGDGLYQITDHVYNFNENNAPYNNLVLIDSELSPVCYCSNNYTETDGACGPNISATCTTTTNRTFNLLDEEGITFSSNVTISGTAIVPFSIATLYNPTTGGYHDSNEPSVFNTVCSGGGSSGGGGGGSSGTPRTCEPCTYNYECTDWSPAVCPPTGIQSRVCINRGTCVGQEFHPVETQTCEIIERTIRKVKSSSMRFPALLDFNALKNIMALLGAIMLTSLLIFLLTKVHIRKFAIYDAWAFIYVLANKPPLKMISKKRFGHGNKFAVNYSTMFDLLKKTKSASKKTKEKAELALWMVDEFNIPIKGDLNIPKYKSHLKQGAKRNQHLIIHNPYLTDHMHDNEIKTNHIHPYQEDGWKVSDHNQGDKIGILQQKDITDGFEEKIASNIDKRDDAILKRRQKAEKKAERKTKVHKFFREKILRQKK